MKKLRITALLIAAVMVFAMLGGCAEKELAYTVLEIGMSDSVDMGKHTSDIPGWSYEKCNPHEDAAAPAEMSVTFNGTTYTGSYQWSDTQMPNAFVCHTYTQKLENGGNVKFRINAQTGELTFITLYNKTEQAEPADEIACRKVADAIADDYISLKDYKVKEDAYKETGYTSYTYTYYREISGYETTDMIRIVVNGHGVVSSCDISMVGTFKNVKKLAIDEEKASATIEAKLKEIYGEHWEKVTEWGITKKQWVKTPDDQCGRLYTIDIDFRDGNSITGSIVKLVLI